MSKALKIFWLLVPVVVVAWHYGPGQAQLARDEAGWNLRQAEGFFLGVGLVVLALRNLAHDHIMPLVSSVDPSPKWECKWVEE